MGPVINPMFFYWLSIVDNLVVIVCSIATIGSILILVAMILPLLMIDGDASVEKFTKTVLKKINIIIISILVFIAIFIPTKETLIEMEVAKNITYDRLDKVVEIGKDLKTTLKSDIIDIIKTINADGDK